MSRARSLPVLALGALALALAAACPPAAAQAIRVEAKDGKVTVEGSLTKEDAQDRVRAGCFCKVYAVKMEAGKSYRIDLMSKVMDSFLRLESPEGNQLAEDDDGGDGRDARLVFACKSTDAYRIVATTCGGGMVGPFTLVVREQAALKVVALALKAGSVTVDSALTADDAADSGRRKGPCKAYSVRMEAGKAYRIDMVSKVMDSFLRLEGPDGKEVATDDDSGGGLNARIRIRCLRTGPHRVVTTVLGGRGRLGPFTLVVQEEGGSIAELPWRKGKAAGTGLLTRDAPPDHARRNSPAVVYAVKLEAGKTYRIDLVSREFDAYLRLEDDQFRHQAEDDDSGGSLNPRITFRCGRGGTYHLVVTTHAVPLKVGAFTLSVEPEK